MIPWFPCYFSDCKSWFTERPVEHASPFTPSKQSKSHYFYNFPLFKKHTHMLHSFRTESKQQNMLFIKKMNKANKNYEIILRVAGEKKQRPFRDKTI